MVSTASRSFATMQGTTAFSFPLPKRFFTIIASPTFLFYSRCSNETSLLFQAVRLAPTRSSRYSPTRCNARHSKGSADLPFKPGTNSSTQPPTNGRGSDYEDARMAMDKPGGEGASKQQTNDCHVQNSSEAVESEEEAKMRHSEFSREMDKETSNKPGAELFVNGEIAQSSPRKVEPVPQRAPRRPTYNLRKSGRVCRFTGKKPNKANKVSFSNHKTIRRQYVNLQYKRIWWEAGNRFLKVRISTKGLKTIEKNGLEAVAKKAGIVLPKR